jgi:hypothetical protein
MQIRIEEVYSGISQRLTRDRTFPRPVDSGKDNDPRPVHLAALRLAAALRAISPISSGDSDRNFSTPA